MTKSNASVAAASAVEWENEGGALAPPPDHAATMRPAEWADLATLGALVAAWPDLSISVRRRITSGAIGAMTQTGQRREPRV